MSTPYYSDDSVTLYAGQDVDVLRTLPDGSVDCCVTSPPYYGLRDYGVDGQRGLEPSPVEYVAGMVEVFREARRVLADDGTLWLNLGDSYSSRVAVRPSSHQDGFFPDREGTQKDWRRDKARDLTRMPQDNVIDDSGRYLPEKNLLGIPWRVAFALQDDGWILRQDNVWAKRNFMPESVTDRTTRAHEYVFHLAKSPRYWYDADAIREDSAPDQEEHSRRYAKEYTAHSSRAADTGQPGNVNNVGIHSRPGKGGRNARSVWSISAQPFPGAHFATMPLALAERCVLAGCKPGGTVLDPYSGSGTTGLAATKHGRRYVGIDLNPEYHDLALKTRLQQAALIPGEAS